MRYYEAFYLINPNLADDDYGDVVTKFSGIIEKNGGVVIKLDEWGKKTLAYEVKKFDKGYYVLLQFCGEPSILTELKRGFRMDERILKYQTIKLSDDADPEALMRDTKEDREQEMKEAEALEEGSSTEEGENGV